MKLMSAPSFSDDHLDGETARLASVLATAIWIGCVTVGVTGLWLRYPRPHAPVKPPPPDVQLLNVEVTKNLSAPPEIGSSSNVPEAVDARLPAEAQVAALPSVPPLTAVAAPSPSIAFTLSVEGPVRIVASPQAMPVRARQESPDTPQSSQAATMASTRPAPVAQQLIYGEGEGKQPAPEYPREAVIARQEGTVVVHFTVGDDGRVRDVEASVPSSSALLNQAAVRAVRETWRFGRGPVRTYEVSIEFKLKQK